MIAFDKNTLFGIEGGQLEYVSQRVEWKKNAGGRWVPQMVIRFTDHDVQSGGIVFNEDGTAKNGLIEGQYYELTFPIGAY